MKVDIAESANSAAEISDRYKDVLFKPYLITVGYMKQRTIPEIKYEPMFFNSEPYFAKSAGDAITREFLDKTLPLFNGLDLGDLALVFDSRVTMTMPGMYPSIPGWHCDDFRRGHVHEQPNLDREGIDDAITHYMGIVGDKEGTSCTEFVTEEVTIELDRERVWNSLDAGIERRKPKTGFIKNGEIVRFNQTAIHRATESKIQTWRWWGRLSLTYRKPINEIRQQVQVYVGRNGW